MGKSVESCWDLKPQVLAWIISENEIQGLPNIWGQILLNKGHQTCNSQGSWSGQEI